ncbi:hypothetical protein GIB67_026077 [Kingdonia uniflora]|uniref:Uncharacterized protein n=1 Tax=Kingdonia uniflora TaxID=39325 RepID=A0A7J7M2X8_9MAGN|nr:hypothetical protein GIB67_026077 [Kingdonia uniflora]
MMRRCILQFSSSRSLYRVPRQITTQMPYFISVRNEFSVASKSQSETTPKPLNPNVKPPSDSGSFLKTFVLVGVGVLTAGVAIDKGYQYLGQSSIREKQPPRSPLGPVEEYVSDVEHVLDKIVESKNEEVSRFNPNVEHVEKKEEVQPSAEVDVLFARSEVDEVPIHLKDLKSGSESVSSETSLLPLASEGSSSKKEIGDGVAYEATGLDKNERVSDGPVSIETETKQPVSEEVEVQGTSTLHKSEDIPKNSLVKDVEPSNSLLDTYFLGENNEKSNDFSSQGAIIDQNVPTSEDKEELVGTSEELKDISKDGKVILDILQVIHAAENKQAELDARIFAKEKSLLKEKFEKELKDAIVKEVMYAEKAAILDKELSKERVKTANTIKLLQNKAEEDLKMEIERKEKETEVELKKVQDLAKAELAAAIVSEKASQIEKMAEADLHIKALCMAFYARSEEARQIHSVHKLALGALALQDALSIGLPIQTEIDALHTYLEGIDKESLLGLALSSLPEETLKSGTDTQLQLSQKASCF